MSDPVIKKSEDVEDVLSSIRRLVSETVISNKPAAVGPLEDAELVDEQAQKEALLLTSALRIDGTTVSSASDVRISHDLAARDEISFSKVSLRNRSADDELGTSDASASSQPVVQAAGAQSPLDNLQENTPTEGKTERSPLRLREMSPSGRRAAASRRLHLTNVPGEESGANEGAPPNAPTDEYYEDEPVTGSVDLTGLTFSGNASDRVTDSAVSKAGVTKNQEDVIPEVIGADDVSETAAPTRSRSRPDPNEIDVDEAEVQSWAGELGHRSDENVDEMTEKTTGAEGAKAEEGAASAHPDLGNLAASAFDEEALRDLIAEVVQQELRGALGERITRNVRKLVRREIHRAMITREFD